jgi:hypothetical protein
VWEEMERLMQGWRRGRFGDGGLKVLDDEDLKVLDHERSVLDNKRLKVLDNLRSELEK